MLAAATARVRDHAVPERLGARARHHLDRRAARAPPAAPLVRRPASTPPATPTGRPASPATTPARRLPRAPAAPLVGALASAATPTRRLAVPATALVGDLAGPAPAATRGGGVLVTTTAAALGHGDSAPLLATVTSLAPRRLPTVLGPVTTKRRRLATLLGLGRSGRSATKPRRRANLRLGRIPTVADFPRQAHLRATTDANPASLTAVDEHDRSHRANSPSHRWRRDPDFAEDDYRSTVGRTEIAVKGRPANEPAWRSPRYAFLGIIGP